MGFIDSLVFFGLMLALAAIPGASVMLVVVRATTLGLGNGIAVGAGIVCGDVVFIVLSLLGLAEIAENLGHLFVALNYAGALYLLWLGYTLLQADRPAPLAAQRPPGRRDMFTSFMAGWLLTLGDVKALIFYLSLFPALVDVAALQWSDMLIIMGLTVLSVGSVKIVYALAATRLGMLVHTFRLGHLARKSAGGIVAGVGAFLLLKHP